jgi:hypothetical protein
MTSQPHWPPPILSLRSFVLIATAVCVALTAGSLTYAAEPSLPAAVLAGGVAFAATLKILNGLIE